MKIGILTFHNALNYGAVLQCYATQELLKSMGHYVEVIDYHNKSIDKVYAPFDSIIEHMPKRKFWMIPRYIVCIFNKIKKYRKFGNFTKNFLSLSSDSYYEESDTLLPNYDVIIIGSDQVWNLKITKGFDKFYWGDFPKGNTKIVAWSVCMNKVYLDDYEEKEISRLINNFDSISVRELSLKNTLEKLTSKKITHTLDPTLILPFSKWNEFQLRNKWGDYILSFSVQNEEDVYKVALNLAKKKKYKVVDLRAYVDMKSCRNSVKTADPIEFMALIKNAKYVVTGSFHGTAFSVIFKKPFYSVIGREKGNSRITSLLDTIGLHDRIVYFDETFDDKLNVINYTSVDPRVVKMRESSIEYLNENVK